MSRRPLIFFVLTLAGAGMAYGPLSDLLSNSVRSDYYSHILLIPFVSGFLIYLKRNRIFGQTEYAVRKGVIVLLAGIVLFSAGSMLQDQLSLNDFAAFSMLSAVVFWIGAFLTAYGESAFRTARFPLLFLVFMIPIPTVFMDAIIHFLQAGSTEVTDLLFGLMGIPAHRSGYFFQLPGITIEVAKECSGIRSSLGLFITAILAAHLFLRTNWKRSLFVLAILPVTILKNGIRILTLTILGVYVDKGFLTEGFLHRSGGFVFFLPALVLMGVLLHLFRKTEDEKLDKR